MTAVAAVAALVTPAPRGVRRVWQAATGLLGGLLGLAPHVLHHVSFLAGTAFVAGSGGTALFAVLGLVVSVPMLLRLRRRFGTWRAPALALVASAAMFALSAFVVGPAISAEPAPEPGHEQHHG